MLGSNESWSFKNFSGQGKQSVLMTVRQCKFYGCVERVREINKVVDFSLRKSPHWEDDINKFLPAGEMAVRARM